MKLIHGAIGSLFAAAFALAPIAVGCSSSDAGASKGDEQNIVPDNSQTAWDLAGLCDQNIQRHAGVKQQELSGGVVRWQCGDRPGVDGADDRGQEYCEYHAISNGKKVTKFADAAADKPLYCFFTSVYQDVDGKSGTVGKRDKALATELSKDANLGAAVDADLVRMKGRFNSRGAATTLIKDAITVEASLNDDRQAACYLASVEDAAKADKLKAACRDKNLSDDANWKVAADLGAKVPVAGDASFEHFRDMAACMSVGRLRNGGVDWRMSDPHITQVVVRAHQECECSYGALPDALEGFLQGTWSSADALPPGCRRAQVDGKDYQQLTVCEVPEAERADLELSLDYQENLQAFCNERFGKDIVLTAPLRAVETVDSCKVKEGSFCAPFTAGANTSNPTSGTAGAGGGDGTGGGAATGAGGGAGTGGGGAGGGGS